MSTKSVIVALDIGTTKVCTLIAHKSAKNLEILGVGSHPSHGLKKGSVVNIEKTVESIRTSIEEAKLMAGIEDLESATVGIAGNHIYCFNSSGVVPVKNKEINQSDVDRVVEAAKAVLIPSDREILHVIPQEFKVDNTVGIKNPIGMCGSRLEVNVHIVTGKTPLIHNLVKCVEQAGLNANEVILQPIASSRSVLSNEEKELGVVLIDIGGGTTDVAVWKDGSLLHSQIIPLGGNHFTNDLAVALKIPHNEAERIKLAHGTVLKAAQLNETYLTVQGLSGTRPREVSLSFIAEVLGARAEELFSVVRELILEKNLHGEITGGFVLTGGGALIKNLPELAEFILEKPVKMGYPTAFGGMTTAMQHPKFSTVLGLLQESKHASVAVTREEKVQDETDMFDKLGKSLKNVFKEIF
ncbi:cell division protein FtsA [Peredibacter starrii]|uniref:Cell division protein FtsA n=1 Tax=Peredibacter starrii TaxID=28202 RepID=A0AAX4HQ56_9BACT|nr:cell division protein FtsA [Peredibacter starrii]WPU65481.1 cell division protein FtsA [Peredibacter starrii]